MYTIFLHGLGQSASAWDKTIKALAGRKEETVKCPALAALLQESGSSVSYEALYRGITKYGETFSEPFSLCGLSLGAVLALNYVLDNPQKVKHLVLIAPQYKMPKGLLKFQNLMFRFMPEKVFADMGMKKRDFIALTNSMLELDFTERLREISCPVLVLVGEKDRANQKAAEEIAAKIPNAERKIVKKAGHEVNVDAPEELAEIITAWQAEDNSIISRDGLVK